MDSPNTSKIDRINNDISKLEQLADKGKFDCNRYVRTNSQCTELEGKKTRDMYKKMLSLLVALSNSVKLGNHMAAEGIRIVYNAECGGNFKINADRAFATLEEGAFRTKWS
ncbi:hypothetical protein KY349_00170, partial [Candidatus Woesearchaeota archaeon]|nr:hypothetical protein [Candidatus Woesearchaeota archaeon]